MSPVTRHPTKLPTMITGMYHRNDGGFSTMYPTFPVYRSSLNATTVIRPMANSTAPTHLTSL